MVRQRENGHDLGWEYFLCLTLRIFVMDNTNLTYIISLLSSKAGTDKRKSHTHTGIPLKIKWKPCGYLFYFLVQTSKNRMQWLYTFMFDGIKKTAWKCEYQY